MRSICINKLEINKNLKIKKEVGIAIKSKETSSKLASYPAMKSMATHSTSWIGYYLCLFIQAQFQLGS